MNCRKARKIIGPYMDGELAGGESTGLERHLASCPGCARQLDFMRGITRQLSSLPVVTPTPGESHRLMNRIRGEMGKSAAPKPAYRGVRVAAIALSILAAATVGTTWAIWGGRGPTTSVEAPTPGGEPSEGQAARLEESTEAETRDDASSFLAASMTQPSLVVSGKDYTPAELKTCHNDLGARLDFYSSYWYPAAASDTGAAGLKQARQQLTDDLARQAVVAGRNPDELKNAIGTALAQAGDETLLPCYAELAKVEGKDAWLVSLSGPEDYLLFSDPQMPPAMRLASLGGEASLQISESLLKGLAKTLTPSYTNTAYDTSLQKESVSVEAGNAAGYTTDAITPSAEFSTLSARVPAATPQQQEFQSFLREVAAQGNNLDLIEALEGLKYEQFLMLLQGNWGALAADGVNLTEFLTPPKRLWAIDAAAGTVIW